MQKSFFKVHIVDIDLADLPFKPTRYTRLRVLIRDPIGAALTLVTNRRISGKDGENVDWYGEGAGAGASVELSTSPGMARIRESVPKGALALILNFFSDKSDVNSMYATYTLFSSLFVYL